MLSRSRHGAHLITRIVQHAVWQRSIQAALPQTQEEIGQHVVGLRSYSFVREVINRVKGEVEKNPELRQSIKDLRERTEGLRRSTKETLEKVDAASRQAAAKAKEVSSVVKERVSEASGQVSSTVKEQVKTLRPEQRASAGEGSATPAVSAAAPRADTREQQLEGEGENARVQAGAEGEAGAEARSESGSNAGGPPQVESEKVEGGGGRHGGDGERVDGKRGAETEAGSSASEGPTAWERAQQLAGSAWTPVAGAFSKLRETQVLDSLKQGAKYVQDELSSTSRRKPRKRLTAEEIEERERAKAAAEAKLGPKSDSSHVVLVPKQQSAWEKRREQITERLRSNPLFQRIAGLGAYAKPVLQKGQELVEDAQEKWETSPSPTVERIRDMNERLFGETPSAVAMVAVRRRDPSFSLADFMTDVQEDVRPVLMAYIGGDLKTLADLCADEVVQRARAERKAFDAMGVTQESKILHISEAQLRDIKLVSGEPMIIIGFSTQQIFCLRDRSGKVVEGAPDEIHTVFYAWAMQQVPPEKQEEGGVVRWQLREMQQQRMQAIV